MAAVQHLAFAAVARAPGGFLGLSRTRSDVGKVKLAPVQVFDLQRLSSFELREEVSRLRDEVSSPSTPRPPSGRGWRTRCAAVETEKAAKVEEYSLPDLEVGFFGASEVVKLVLFLLGTFGDLFEYLNVS